MKNLELLMPAGDLNTLKVAIRYGADAIYIGGDSFSLRAKAKNFDSDGIREAIRLCHENNVKLYITANIFAHNYDIDDAIAYFKSLNELKPDAIIISDMGMFSLAKEYTKDIELHISTQANSTNYMSFKLWKELGASRVVAARELSLDEIRQIHDNVDIEIETFVHGAMCMSYSGRCLLSNYMTGRDANRGECTHPCRWKYNLVEENRPGEYLPVYENERGTYIFNSKDLCMIDKLDDIINAGIYSLKVEGRMKTALYVASVTRAYRMAIDDYFEDPSLYRSKINTYLEEIKACTYRHFTRGFYYGKPDNEAQIYDANTYEKGAIFIGTISAVDEKHIYFEQKNKFLRGDEITIMLEKSNLRTRVLNIYNEKGEEMESAPHPNQMLKVSIDAMSDEIREGLTIRM